MVPLPEICNLCDDHPELPSCRHPFVRQKWCANGHKMNCSCDLNIYLSIYIYICHTSVCGTIFYIQICKLNTYIYINILLLFIITILFLLFSIIIISLIIIKIIIITTIYIYYNTYIYIYTRIYK